MDLQLRDKVIIVTGGAKGIGQSIAEVLAKEGAIPFIIGRNESDNEKVVKGIEAAGGKAARAKGVTTSIDLNYRKKLWSKEKAREVMSRLCQYVDVCIGNEEDADTTLGFKAAGTDVTKGELNLDGYKDVFKQMKDKFNFKYIASTLRESHSASDNGWSALVYDGKEFYHTKQYEVRIVDRVGSGDSFASGFIYGLVTGMPMKEAAEFGVAASAIKHTIPGDLNHATLSDVTELMKGDGSGRVQR